MKRVKITNKSGVVGWCAELENPTEWISECIASNAWGFPERPEIDSAGNETGVILPAEYIIEIEDITNEVEQQKNNSDALAYLAETDWLIIREMDSGVPCPEEIKTKRQEARAKVVR